MSQVFIRSNRFFSPSVLRFFVFLFFALILTSCESKKTIVHGLDEREANDIIVFLDTKGIEATKVQAQESGGGGGNKIVYWDISVEAPQATEAMALLNASGLPRRPGQNLLSIFSKGALVPSELEEKIRYQAGLGEQIANVIRKIDGVLDADVQLSFPEQDPLNPMAQKQKVTASVYVKHTGVLDDPNTHLITKIRRLVASSIQGLDYDNVTIIPDRARFSEVPFRPLGSTHMEEKQYESVWTIIIAKDSVFRFRVIFFSFMISILILFIILCWILWKLYPLASKFGGLKQLLSLHPTHLSMLQDVLKKNVPPSEKDEKKEEKEGDKKKEKEPEDSGEAT